MQPGDLVFASNSESPGTVSHVGIYVGYAAYGDCTMIDSAGGRGSIGYDDMCSNGKNVRWRTNLMGARRIVPCQDNTNQATPSQPEQNTPQTTDESGYKTVKATTICNGDKSGSLFAYDKVKAYLQVDHDVCDTNEGDYIDLFVALPSRSAAGRLVQIKNPSNGRVATARVADLGPFCREDNTYVNGNSRPYAEIHRKDPAGRKDSRGNTIQGTIPNNPDCNEKEGSNGAGIDLSIALAKYLGVSDSQVSWKFAD